VDDSLWLIQKPTIPDDTVPDDSDVEPTLDMRLRINLARTEDVSLPQLATALEAEPTPAVAQPLLVGLLSDAFSWNAAAIRFHSAPQGLVVQYSVDGSWRSVLRLPDWASRPVMGGLRELLSEQADAPIMTLDGLRPVVQLASGRRLGFTTAAMQDNDTERLTLFVRDPTRNLTLDTTGLTSDTARRLRQWTAARQGLILLVGPRNSGQTTLLRAIADSLAGYREVQSVLRDPVAPMDGWVERGASDEDGEKAVARALEVDPAVLVVDECDGPRVASAAFTAALQGRLVVAAIRGPTTSAAIQRLREQGTSDLLLGEQLLGVVETRLVRLLCRNCWVKGPLDRDLAQRLNLVIDSIPSQVPTAGPGCPTCHHTGYRGRRAVVSRVELDGGLKDGASAEELRQAVTMHRPRTPAEVGLTLVMQGLTSLEEVGRMVTPGPPRPSSTLRLAKPVTAAYASQGAATVADVPPGDDAPDPDESPAPDPTSSDPEAKPDPAPAEEAGDDEAAPEPTPESPIVVVDLEEVSADPSESTVDAPSPVERSLGVPLVSLQSPDWAHDTASDTVAEEQAPQLDDDDALELLELLQFDDTPVDDDDDRHLLLALDPRTELAQHLRDALPQDEFRVVALKTLEDAAAFVHQDLPTAIVVSAGWHFDAGGAIRAFRNDLASAFLPVLVLSDDDDHNVELLRAGADEIIPVDTTHEELELRLRAVIRRVT
jgi:type II secretory ATPase GspE/PulE/Tfp pilus assembly ATPase PilB-like protein